MTSEFLLDAIGQMDDELVMEAAQSPAHRPVLWRQLGAVAAALLLCAGIASLPGLLPRYATSGDAMRAEDAIGNLTADMELQDGSASEYEYRADQESKSQAPTASDKAASATGGLFEPKFFTEQGVYLPIVTDSGGLKQKTPPPENATPLGELVACVPGQQVYPATGTQALVGCPVWESEDSEHLYILLPDGHWITAALFN